MSAISETYITLRDNFHFISGLEIMREYATEAFTIDVVEVAVISVSGCKSFSKEDLQTLLNLGWEAWTQDGRSGAEFRKLRYVDY